MSKRFISNNDFLRFCNDYIEVYDWVEIVKGKYNIKGADFSVQGLFMEVDDNKIIMNIDNDYYSYSVNEILIFMFGEEYFYLYENFS